MNDGPDAALPNDTASSIRALLESLPEVGAAAVVPSTAGTTCHVVLAPGHVAEHSLAREEDWRYLFDSIYGNDLVVDGDMDVTGFTSAYTREPIPRTQMRAWQAATLARIRPCLPERPRILEIGCGTGLILRGLAPGSERYAVVDFSAPALERLRAALRGSGLDHIEYHHAAAADLPPDLRDFDAVIVAQVSQYFPGEEYLRRVLAGALDRVRPTGVVYLDARSLPLLETFHLSAQLVQTPHLRGASLVGRLRDRVLAEDELVVHPAFFVEAAASLGARVTVAPRLGRTAKELTAYRYDVLLSPAPRDARTGAAEAPHWRPWGAEGWTLARLRSTLTGERPDVLPLTEIPHAMLVGDLTEHHRLGTRTGCPSPVPPVGDPVLPEDLHRAAEDAGYRLSLGAERGSPDGTFDAVLSVPAANVPPMPGPAAYTGPLTSDPSRREAAHRALRRIGGVLESRLAGARAPITVLAVPALPHPPDGGGDGGGDGPGSPVPGRPPLAVPAVTV